MSRDKSDLGRRRFLLALAAGGTASAAAIAVTTVPLAQPAVTGDSKKKTRGYHASAHIRNYYRTAKV